jgi:hypothetical protein
MSFENSRGKATGYVLQGLVGHFQIAISLITDSANLETLWKDPLFRKGTAIFFAQVCFEVAAVGLAEMLSVLLLGVTS